MFRNLATLLMLSTALPGLAFARDTAVAEQRAEVHEARKHARQVERLERKFSKAAEKGKDDKLAKLGDDIHDLTLDELARLRSLGVRTHAEPPPLPDQPTKVRPPEHPRLEAQRDDLVELRQLSAGAIQPRQLRRTEALLGDLSDAAADRRAAAEARLERLKASS